MNITDKNVLIMNIDKKSRKYYYILDMAEYAIYSNNPFTVKITFFIC